MTPTLRLRQPALQFEENRGQFDARARFVARQRGLTVFVTDAGAVMTLRARGSSAPVVVRLAVHDGLAGARSEPRDRLPTRSNYFLGNDPHRWRTDVPSFASVVQHGVRPGVDLVYHGGDGGRLEYDFVVAPGASPDVSIDVDGADALHVAADGTLEIRLPGGVLRQPPPVVYQEVDGRRRTLRAAYRLAGRSRVGFLVAKYDRTRPLVIDPVVMYSTYLGGSGGDFAEYQAAVDGNGSVYVVGSTSSTNFPTTNAMSSALNGTEDGFVAKLTPAGDAFAYATYLGGSGVEEVYGVAVDGSGAAYLAGRTTSADFPTKNPIQAYAGTVGNGSDAFVTKLTPAGNALVYSTFLGGHAYDGAKGIAIDVSGAAYVVGETLSTDFPMVNPLQSSFAGGNGDDGFVAKLTPAGDALVYSTYFGGTKNEYLQGIAVDGSNQAILAGATASTDLPHANALQPALASADDAWVAKLTAAGNALVYGTYLGGSGEDYGYAVATDGDGAAYVVGQTASADFPTTAGAFDTTVAGTDAFVVKVAPDGSTLEYATFLGGSTTEFGYGIAVDATGAAYVGGSTLSQDFPVRNAVQSSNAGNFDGFVSKLTPAGDALVYSTYLGGSYADELYGVAVDAKGAVYVSGWTGSTDFPTANAVQPTFGGGTWESFVAKIGNAPLIVDPTSATVPPRGSQAFTASGGSGGYTWTLTTNASGGSVDGSGAYVAGSVGSVTDTLQLADSDGDVVTATIQVTAGVSIVPGTATVGSGDGVAFTASGGSGTGWSWTLDAGASGTIDAASGAYVAGAMAGVDTVHVVDSLGNTASATVTIQASQANDLSTSLDLGAVSSDMSSDAEPADLAPGGADLAQASADLAQQWVLSGRHGCACAVGARDASVPLAPLGFVVVGLGAAIRRRRRAQA
jgi:MYXO-CTERM domain-containing protein